METYNKYECEICKDDNDYSTYFTGQGKCSNCWNYFREVGSWRNVKRNRLQVKG
tara:strand:- start:1554 stop:1715 length:162 start_codon:yes stop_codon:yes gene_type:complete